MEKIFPFFVILVYLKVTINDIWILYCVFLWRYFIARELRDSHFYFNIEKKTTMNPCTLELYKCNIWKWSLNIHYFFFLTEFSTQCSEKDKLEKISLFYIAYRSKKWQPTSVFLPGKFHRQRSLQVYSSWCGNELDTTEHSSSI